MSTLIVDVCPIKEVRPHPNADSLSLAIVKGWQVVFNHESVQYSPGDAVIYVPPDTMVPRAQAEKWGVDKYLSFSSSDPDMGRTLQVRLRGEMSFGFLARPDGLPIGESVVERFGLQKWEPPLRAAAGDEDTPCNFFTQYTDIQNWRNFPDVFQADELVIATEKIHGTNCRIGLCVVDGEPTMMVGSRTTRKKLGQGSMYEPQGLMGPAEEMLRAIRESAQRISEVGSVILFGEVFGRVQDLRYGLPNALAFRAFDMSIDGQYMNHEDFTRWCDLFSIPTVPVIYRGPMDLDELKVLATGRTTLMAEPGKKDLLEGLVVKPLIERTDPTLGRVILKLISDEYLLRKHGTEDH